MTNTSTSATPLPTVPPALLEALHHAHRVVILSGAGMSAESGIPTFRDNTQSLWGQYDATEMASAEGWSKDRELVWAWYEWRRGVVMQAQPNAGHLAIPLFSKVLSRLTGHPVAVDVVTQNVDDLHERAGLVDVQHLHGSLFAPRCFTCARPGEFSGPPPPTPVKRLVPPRCSDCGGFLRPGVVWFGESLPELVWKSAQHMISQCDVLLMVGTSGVVYPVAGLPAYARQRGKWVGEINPVPSSLRTQMHLQWPTTAALGFSSLLHALSA